MTPEQWLSDRIRESGMKQKFIAEKTGIPDFSAQKLSFALNGYRKIQVDEFLAVCAVIGISPTGLPLTEREEKLLTWFRQASPELQERALKALDADKPYQPEAVRYEGA